MSWPTLLEHEYLNRYCLDRDLRPETHSMWHRFSLFSLRHICYSVRPCTQDTRCEQCCLPAKAERRKKNYTIETHKCHKDVGFTAYLNEMSLICNWGQPAQMCFVVICPNWPAPHKKAAAEPKCTFLLCGAGPDLPGAISKILPRGPLTWPMSHINNLPLSQSHLTPKCSHSHYSSLL